MNERQHPPAVQRLIASAARAIECFDEDELEAFADTQRQEQDDEAGDTDHEHDAP